MASSSPTARTLEWLRKQGMTAGVVERRNPKMRFVTHDYLGFIDVIAVGDGFTVGIQATSNASNVCHRINKILEECPDAPAWIRGGNRIWVVGWSKKGPAGKTKHWTPTVREIVLQGEQLTVVGAPR